MADRAIDPEYLRYQYDDSEKLRIRIEAHERYSEVRDGHFDWILGLLDARQGTATDPKIAALVAFAQQVAAAPSEVSDEQVEALREHGWRDEQIADVVGLVALNVLTGSFNLVAGIHRAADVTAAA